MGNGEWGMGNGEWGMGNGEWGTGNGEWGVGNGECGKAVEKGGHIVAETLLFMTFPFARKLGNICCGHKMFLNKIRNIFVSQTQNLCPQQMLRARANGETFVSATMCLQQCVLVS